MKNECKSRYSIKQNETFIQLNVCVYVCVWSKEKDFRQCLKVEVSRCYDINIVIKDYK